ncbi:D-cysteine desulfhydrase family protein [Photobacterium sp. S4TG1]|uniref:D-cysteine desulfhydrase family protein n=1 Tax=Photobacterium sp. S4TG1 TaxID=3114587 RepID=UPI002E18663E|nr:D-cysteine desulfhydrase family protein [Photobacterium sp. S4TG1]
MSLNIKKAKQLISLVPRVELCFLPTPMHKLERLSKALGINLYIKRDDFTGKNLFGGNKTRKLEFLIGKAIEDKCEYVFTYGATQSNHAMQTAWTAAASNLKSVLYLAAVVDPDENDIKSNLLLDKIFDAELHIVDLKENESFGDATKRAIKLGSEHIRRLEATGKKCMNIPVGGANEIGTVGYISGFVEIEEQAEKMNIDFDYLYHASGSGGTMAGLVAGKKLISSNINVQSVITLSESDNYISSNVKNANSALEYIGAEPIVIESDFDLNRNFLGPGYECPSEASSAAIKLLAKQEGILLDPVYTGKAFAGLLNDIHTGKIKSGSNVIFLHTGGATALFAEKDILGDLF